MHRPQPLHSSVSIRSDPRSRFPVFAMLHSFLPLVSDEGRRRLALQIMRAHGKILQLRLELRICNGNQRFGAFAQRLAVETRRCHAR